MKRLALLVLAVAAALSLPGNAHAIGQCGLPSRTTLWIDFGTPDLLPVFGRKGTIVTASSGDFPAQVKATGAQTLYWDMHLNKRVGVPSAPASPDVVVDRANKLFDFAATQTGCEKPLIALNEMFGAGLETPWTRTNEQYRSNLMTFLRTLAERGARPFLLVPGAPFMGSPDAIEWWREAGKHADFLAEVYFSAPPIHRLGPIVAQRRMRIAMRTAVARFTEIGIPRTRLGIMLGFQTGRGFGGREGLQPRSSWFEFIKWNVLAAKQIVRETGVASVWSWGWGPYAAVKDLDREAAACVYLWTRDPSLCAGPRAAGRGFNASLTEGQLHLPGGRQCSLSSGSISAGEVAQLQAVTGDREVALTALLARVSERPYAKVTTKRVLASERAVINLRFAGSRGAYLAALARARATVTMARAILADELRRDDLEAGLPGRRPALSEVAAFYSSYPDLLVRRVRVKPAPRWLDGRKEGLVLSAIAPEQLFDGLATGKKVQLRALDGTYTVTPLGDTVELGSVPLEAARFAIANALRVFARRATFESWTIDRQEFALRKATCRRDELPQPGAIRLSGYIPFLALS